MRRVRTCRNTTETPKHSSMGAFVEKLEWVIPNADRAQWVGEEFLLEKDVRELGELPLWISERAHWPGFMTIDVSKAISQGLVLRPLEKTILDTLGWDQTRQPGRSSTRPHGGVGDVGLSRAREAELLRKWTIRSGG